MLKPIIIAVSIMFTSALHAQEVHSESVLPDAKTFKEEVKGGLETKGVVIGMQELPIVKLMFVEAEQGNYIISADGRFVFEGTLKDVWHRRTIKTVKDVIETRRTPASNIGFKPEDQLAHFVVGNPDIPRQGVAFVDPTSGYTLRFLKDIMRDKENTHWTVVLMPLVGGNQAIERSLRLWCATDRELALNDLISGGNKSFDDIREGCNDEKILLGMMLVDLFHITSLPHLLREDGLISNGYPEKFNEWFKQP